MSMTDPIADFLARIRNAILARHAEVLAPSSKLKQQLCVLLKNEGYIAGYDVRDGGDKAVALCLGDVSARADQCPGTGNEQSLSLDFQGVPVAIPRRRQAAVPRRIVQYP